MQKNMKSWIEELRTAPIKKAFPILSFPSISLMGTTVRELIASGEMQARGMRAVADRIDSAASVSMMDLSVEAEAFGATARISEDEVPTIIDTLVHDEAEADALVVPTVTGHRTERYVDAIAKACKAITDRPVFAGVIGPFSLAGRLLDVTEIMMLCYDEPDMVHTVLQKATAFLIDYIRAYRAVGANGVVVAEPLAGLLSPALMREFAAPYMKEVVDAVQTEDFIVIYHNCGNAVMRLVDDILSCGASAYHFGNAIDIKEMLERVPADVMVMGNIDPVAQFTEGTAEGIYAETTALLERCAVHPNFLISSGCDIPPRAKWENIDAFFRAVKDFYERG